jgi:hypothetical protein
LIQGCEQGGAFVKEFVGAVPELEVATKLLEDVAYLVFARSTSVINS